MKYLLLGILLSLSSNIVLAKANAAGQYPQFLTVHNDSHQVTHTGFTLSYNQKLKQPDWVQYDLRCSDLDNPVARTDDFREDSAVPGGTLDQFDYKKTGYDRGHIAPARDMARTTKTMSESFLMSNMSPQNSFFNRYGLWRKSETAVRTWACENDKITVVGGPILNGEVKQVGKLFVPRYFYKVILADNHFAIGFIFENGKDQSSIENFAVSVDQVEEMTGIDFFSYLPDDIEAAIESNVDTHRWSFRDF